MKPRGLLVKSLILFVAWMLTNVVSHGQVSTSYTTDWVGNNNPVNSVTGYVGNCARSMWVAPDGVVYTASLWDENGRNIGVYKNGAAIGAMGGNGTIQGSSITGDGTYIFAALQNFPGYVGRFNRATGVNDLKFQVSPTGTGDCCPGLADYNGTLVYASDNPGNRIAVYTTAGVYVKAWNVTAPGAIALETSGSNLWVANKTARTVTRYDTSTGAAGTVIQMPSGSQPSALNINAAGQLWIGDSGPNQNIRIYTNITGTPTLLSTYGVPGGYLSTANGAIMGQTGAMRFTRVVGIGSDTGGNVYVLNNPWGGTWDLGRNGATDLHCYNRSGTLLYTLQALNFEGNAAPDPGTNGVNLYSGNILYNQSASEGGYLANTVNPFLYPSDPRINVLSQDRGTHFGQVACVGGTNRILVACGQNPDIFFSYYFNAANGYIAVPGQTFGTPTPIRNGFCLDTTGSIWTGLDKTNAIQYNQLTGFNASGAPIWAAPVSTPTPASIAPLTRIEYVPATDTMVLTGGTTWTLVGSRVEVYKNWKAGNRTPNPVVNLTRAVAKSISAAGKYLFVGYYAIPTIDVFDLNTGNLALSLVSNNNVYIGNDVDSMYGIKAYLGPDGVYTITKDNYNANSVIIYSWNPAGFFQTTNVLNPNGHSLVQATSSGIAKQTDQSHFAADVATAYSSNMGGLVNFDVAGNALTPGPSIVARYGANASKSLTIDVTPNSAIAISPLAPPSGTTGIANCLSAPNSMTDPNLGNITFDMGAITGGLANEKVTTFAFTYLTQTVLNNITLTVTATFSDNSTSVVTRTINRSTTSPVYDTFFGFVAPNGAWITSVSLGSNTTRGSTTYIDDVGFITSVVGAKFHTTNVINPNNHTLIQATSTANVGQTNQAIFATNVATAYANNLGGVVNFDVANDDLTSGPAMIAMYGSGKTLNIGLTAGSALAISPLAPPSGATGAINCLSAPNGTSDPNLGAITFTMGAITGGLTNEKVTSFAFTYLTETALNGITVTVTATFSDNSTSVVTRTVNRNTTSPVNDTFYGFVAPSGKSIVSVSLVSNTNRGATTNIDDVSFTTSVVP